MRFNFVKLRSWLHCDLVVRSCSQKFLWSLSTFLDSDVSKLVGKLRFVETVLTNCVNDFSASDCRVLL